MRRWLIAALFLTASPLLAKHQSYVTYDAGDHSVVVQAESRREVRVRVNLPVFPGDELQTGRRGRTEVRLADGNIVALDRSSSLAFASIDESYDGDSERTVLRMRYGTAVFQRLSSSDESVRVDSAIASYVMSRDTVFSLESDGSRGDVVAVYEGSVEVRSPSATDRVRAGEEVRLDEQGIYSSNTTVADGTTEFERWFLRRANRYDRRDSRYLDSRLAYADSDLDSHGSWVYVSDYSSWVWRPRVSVGWRPYYHGEWVYSPSGSLVWVSDEPWGWVPYHYGRWAYSPAYGWVWLPGSGYSPAWVYWVFGPSYVGWIPAGWYDCYRPYYDWMYRRHSRAGIDFGFGFYGRVRLRDIDLNGWTFVDANTLLSHRADRAALAVDRIRERLARDGDLATVTGAPVRFTRDQIRNPEAAVGTIARGGFGGGTGKGSSGSLTDLTSFIRRDPELPGAVRDRITRGLPPADPSGERTAGRGTLPRDGSEGTSGGVIERGRGNDRTTAGGGGIPSRIVTPDRGTTDRSGSTIGRERPGRDGGSTDGGVVRRGGDETEDTANDWRSGTIRRRESERRESDDVERRPVRRAPDEPIQRERPGESWRSAPRATDPDGDEPATRIPRRGGARDEEPEPRRQPRADEPDDTPRRVIDRIGGARVDSDDRTPRARPTKDRSSSTVERPRAERVERPRAERSEGGSSDRSSSSRERSESSRKGSSNIKPD